MPTPPKPTTFAASEAGRLLADLRWAKHPDTMAGTAAARKARRANAAKRREQQPQRQQR